ncbi:hypothetical protein [Luteibacter sp. 22Crub2.1]|uniref:hypothetical protein n=1 Tax=Luteibacter sp. 22Crub2.1 TaxID=1283288 RepID=UPI0009A5D4C5|nr:hypothetical protein [Luteibacter sp. 22Crub2.1]SKB97726.1 hypothetical protein SAMN05660880_03558 [Luteibacter sp. 22Crub2.1]
MLQASRNARPFAPWRIVVWLVMLLAAAGFVINAYASVVVAHAAGALTEEAVAGGPSPRIALAWSVGYTLAAFGIMVVALSTLRWRAWARDAMRLVALLLMVWAAYTAWFAYGQWQQIGVVLGQPGLPPDLVAVASRQHTIMLVSVILKVVSVPLLGWLAWALGSVRVRQQFLASGL